MEGKEEHGMGMCTPGGEHRKLKSLEGTWVAEEKIYPSPWDPKGGTALGRVVSRMDLDGFFLISDYVQERGGQVAYRGHGVFGWDGEASRYTMHWFDSMGSPAGEPAKGTWEGNRLAFGMQSPMGHHRYTYNFEGEGRYSFSLEHSQDGREWTKFMEGKYTRK